MCNIKSAALLYFHGQTFGKTTSGICAYVSRVMTEDLTYLRVNWEIFTRNSPDCGFLEGLWHLNQTFVQRFPFGYVLTKIVMCKRHPQKLADKILVTIVGNYHLSSFNRLGNIWGSP